MSGGLGGSTGAGAGSHAGGGGGGGVSIGGGAAVSGTAAHSSADAAAGSVELRQCRPHTSAPISVACAMIEMVTPVLQSSSRGGRSSGRGPKTLLMPDPVAQPDLLDCQARRAATRPPCSVSITLTMLS